MLPLMAWAQPEPDFVDYLLADGRWDDVVRLTTIRLERHPRDGRLYSQRAGAYLQTEHYAEAIHDLDRAIQYYKTADKSLLRLYTMRGTLYESRGDDRAALRDYQRIIKLYPDSTVGYALRAARYLYQGEYALALADYTTLCRLAPTSVDYRIGRARSLCLMERLSEADVILRDVILSAPDCAEAYRLLALIHVSAPEHIDYTIAYNNLYYAAHQSVDDLVELVAYTDSDAVYLIEALSHQIDTITSAPLRYHYLSLRAVCYEELNDAARAMDDLEALSAMTDSPSAWIDEHRALVCMSKGQWQRAIDYYTALLSYEPTRDVAYIQRARCWEELGDTLAAERDYQHLVTSHSLYSGYANYCTGRLYLNQRDYRSAEYAFTDALEELQQAVIYMARARAYVGLNRPQAAQRDLDQALALDPALSDDADYVQLFNMLHP